MKNSLFIVVAFAGITLCGIAGAQQQVQTDEKTLEVAGLPNAAAVHSPNPLCKDAPQYKDGKTSYLGQCVWIEVVIPSGAQILNAYVEARDHYGTGPWKDCPTAKGSVYSFMDCARNANGYLRFLNNRPQVESRADGIHVRWEMMNWAAYPREGRLTVNYQFY